MRIIRALFLIATAAGMFAVSACGDDGGGAGPTEDAGADAGGDAGADGGDGLPEMPALEWSPCPLFSDDPDGGPEADCATAIVPLDWSAPEGTRLDIAVKRVRAEGATSFATELWLIPGGPGYPGMVDEPSAKDIVDADPSIEVFLWDHRGVGESTRLTCPDQEAAGSTWGNQIAPTELLGCGESLVEQWGDGLAFFNPNEAARDLSSLVDRTRGPDERVFIYGMSYGTMVVQRYLKVAPTQATAVALDGSVNPNTRNEYTYYQTFSDVIAAYVEGCADDAVCSSKLGSDPVAKLDELMTAQGANACPAFAIASNLDYTRAAFNAVAYSWQYRPFIPALVYRLLRCSDADKAAALKLYQTLYPTGAELPAWQVASSFPLLQHYTSSEKRPEVLPTLAEQVAFVDSLYSYDGSSVSMLQHDGEWPEYEVAPEDREIPVPQVPTLIVHGTLDPRTPLADARLLAEAMATDHTVYVELLGGVHGLITPSAVNPFKSDPTKQCAMELFWSWIADPTAIDTSCADSQPAIDYAADPALVAELFGTADLWE